MIAELVVDTNVLAHCFNHIEARSDDALALVEALSRGEQLLCVDEGFDLVESRNTSRIATEYLKHIHVGTPGYYLLIALASAGRILILPKRPPHPVTKCINQCIANKADRTFVGVAWHSSDRILVSHDYQDLSEDKRQHLRETIDVDVIDAATCLALLEAA